MRGDVSTEQPGLAVIDPDMLIAAGSRDKLAIRRGRDGRHFSPTGIDALDGPAGHDIVNMYHTGLRAGSDAPSACENHHAGSVVRAGDLACTFAMRVPLADRSLIAYGDDKW